MNIASLFDRVHNAITLDYNDNMHNLDEVYIMPNPKTDDAFYLIVKQNNKYICVCNNYRYCTIDTPNAIIKTKFNFPYVYNRVGQLAIITTGVYLIIIPERSMDNAK